MCDTDRQQQRHYLRKQMLYNHPADKATAPEQGGKRETMWRLSWLTFLLGAVACVEIAHSLVCFSCEGEASNWKCLQMITCPAGAQNCLTIGSPSGNDAQAGRLITKMCSQSCPTLSDHLRRLSSSVYCCDHSWCNLWGPR